MLAENRPSWEKYYMSIAHAVKTRANCSRRAVGAIIVVDRGIVSTGYNGTPFGVTNCNEGGCARCASDIPSLEGYEFCICVHAEQNAIAEAARRGIAIRGGTLYSTLRPCIGCLKELIQTNVLAIFYEQDLPYARVEMENVYKDLVAQSRVNLVQYSTEEVENSYRISK